MQLLHVSLQFALVMWFALYLPTCKCSSDNKQFLYNNYECNSDSDCTATFKQSPEQCAICADDHIVRGARCQFLFPYMFQDGNLSCSWLDPCPLDCPKDRGECHQSTKGPLVYAPGCSCEGRYYGDKCQFQEEGDQKVVRFVSWQFKGIIPVGNYVPIKLIVFNRNVLDHVSLQLHFTAENGYYEFQQGSKGEVGKCVFKSPICSAYTFKVRFPFKSFNSFINSFFSTYKDQILGYMSKINFEIHAYENIIYNKTFPVFVSYKEALLKCVASIKLTNCVADSGKPTMFTRPAVIDLKSEVTFTNDGKFVSTLVENEACAADSTFIWKMWALTGEQDDVVPLFQNYTLQVWRFHPFSLDFGSYKVMFEVKNAQVKGVSLNFAYCYIQITSLPLNIVVDGGSHRIIRKESGVTLSASQSTDPNMPATSNQKDLFVTWSCTRIKPYSANDPMCSAKTMDINKSYFISPEQLSYNAVYNFTLELWSRRYVDCDHCGVNPKRAYLTIEVDNATLQVDVSIECVKNCKINVIPGEILILKATSENADLSYLKDLEWTYYKTSEGEERSVGPVKVEGMPSFMLLLKEDTLESGTEYTILVRDYKIGYYAKYSLKTADLRFKITCNVNPQNGTKGLTFFDILCSANGEYALMYEFYDKNPEDAKKNITFNGRMLGTSSTGQLRGVQLSRGIVTVFITDSQGMTLKKELYVELMDWNVTNEFVDALRKNLSDLIMYFSDEARAVRLMSLIPDIMPSGANKMSEFDNLLNKIAMISLDTISGIKLTSSTLYIILTTFNTPEQLVLDTYILTSTLDFIEDQAFTFSKLLLNREQSEYLTTKEVKLIAESILCCLQVTFACKNNSTSEVNQDDLRLEDLLALKHSSVMLEGTMNALADILSYIQSPGQLPTRISSDNNATILWVVENNIADYEISRQFYGNNDIPISASSAVFNSLVNKKYKKATLCLRAASIQDNIFWWQKSYVKSNLIFASIAKRTENNKLSKMRHLKYPLDMRIKMADVLSRPKIESSVQQIDPKISDQDVDQEVKIHRLDIMPRSIMVILFCFPPTNGSLRVSVMKHYRPNYEHMVQQQFTISQQSPIYTYHYEGYDEPAFLYMGIIPGQDVPANQTVFYSFEVNSSLCQYWHYGSWKSEGCSIGPDTRGQEINCQCKHLSVFAASFLVPPEQIDPFEDYKLFLTVLDNPLVVSIVSIFLVTYILLCICLRFKDKKDANRRNVIVLEDNFPLDKHPYLLAVFTSPRINAGTTANVGIRIFGSEGNSRAHVLSSSKRSILKTGYDDWFLIYSPQHLGTIQNLHLWHDNSGSSPSWFCTKIFLYDLQDKTETKFIIEQWLALQHMKVKKYHCYPEANVVPVNEEDISDVKRRFIENFVLGIRDGHKILSIFYSHPRSEMTRLQRLTIIMVYIMVTMLCSIMFYKPDDGYDGVDDYRYSVSVKEIIISIECLVIGVVITSIVIYAFKRGNKYNTGNPRRKSSISQRNRRPTEAVYSSFVKFVNSWIKRAPLPPVQIQGTETLVKTRKLWMTIAWISSIAIILTCSYLVMLYGLKLGMITSKKWLSTVLLSIGEDSLLLAPAKFILFSALLSLAFQQLLEINTYQISAHGEQIQKSLWKEENLEKVLTRRKHSMYAPLSIEMRAEITRKKQINANWWSLFEFLISAGFLFVTCNIILGLWTSHYYTNNHIQNMITNTKFSFVDSTSFYKVSHITELENYLSKTFVNVVYYVRWYNNQKFDKEESKHFNYWTSDCTNRLVGRPRIRQLRVVPTPCDNIVAGENGNCIPRWTPDDEDTNIYAKRWKAATYFDVYQKNSPWIYTEKSSAFMTTLIRLYGSSGRLFHNGGYSMILGRKRLEVEQTLDELKGMNWQDPMTRVVFMELTIFNGNQHLFTQITLVVEYLVSGTTMLKVQATSVSSDFKLDLWYVIFVFFIVFYLLRTIYLINFFGLLEYLSISINNISRILIIITAIISISLFSIHFYTSSHYAENFQKSGGDDYFEFDSFVEYFVLLQISLSLLLCILIFWLIASIRGGVSLLIHVTTFTNSIRWIVWFFLGILLLLFLSKQFNILLNIFVSQSPNEMLMSHKSMTHISPEELQRTHVQVFLVLKTIILYFIKGLLLVLFVYYTKQSKLCSFEDEDKFNFIIFLTSRLKKRKTSSNS